MGNIFEEMEQAIIDGDEELCASLAQKTIDESLDPSEAIEKGFAKDVLEHFPGKKPHINTISSLIRSLESKAYVAHKAFGNTYEYFPIISKEEYTSQFLSGFIGNY